MRPAERYRFTLLASVLVGSGWRQAIGDSAVSSGPLPWPRLLVAAVTLVGGLLVGAPLILVGQLVQVFLDQRRLLASIHHRLRRWEDERESERAHPMRGPVRPP